MFGDCFPLRAADGDFVELILVPSSDFVPRATTDLGEAGLETRPPKYKDLTYLQLSIWNDGTTVLIFAQDIQPSCGNTSELF